MSSRGKQVRPSVERANPFNGKEKLITDPVFIIGNGRSRMHFDLERLREHGTIIGCNALYRDFSPDILVAIDAKLLKEIMDSKYADDNFCIIPGNRTIKVPNAAGWRTERFNTAGCFSMKMVTQLMKAKTCYMLGMDCYPGNVYDETKNYAPNTLQNFGGVGSFYVKALKEPGETIFINVNEKDGWPKECYDTGRYKFISYNEFETTVMK